MALDNNVLISIVVSNILPNTIVDTNATAIGNITFILETIFFIDNDDGDDGDDD